MSSPARLSPVFDRLASLARDRILILDGAMGTQIQSLGFGEAEFTAHGAGCACHPPMFGEKPHPQQGNNDLRGRQWP